MTYVPVGKNNPEVWEDPNPEVDFEDPWENYNPIDNTPQDDEVVFIDGGGDGDWLKVQEAYAAEKAVAQVYESQEPYVDPAERAIEDAEERRPFAEEVRITITRLNVCPNCGKVIEPTGKKGRPRKTHKVCPTEPEGL